MTHSLHPAFPSWSPAEELLELLVRSGRPAPCLSCLAADVAPLGTGAGGYLADRETPAVARYALTVLLDTANTDSLPDPQEPDARLHVQAATRLAVLARLVAAYLPHPPADERGPRRAEVPLSGHDRTWRPEPDHVLVALHTLAQDAVTTGWIDPLDLACHLADLHDAARVYAAEVDLVVGLHGYDPARAAEALDDHYALLSRLDGPC